MNFKWILGSLVVSSLVAAVVWSMPSKQTIEYKMKNVKNDTSTYHSMRRMDVN
jgi:hypothetical protein